MLPIGENLYLVYWVLYLIKTCIHNRVSDKIVPITEYIWACRSGSAADTQAVVDYVKHYLEAHWWAISLYNTLPLV